MGNAYQVYGYTGLLKILLIGAGSMGQKHRNNAITLGHEVRTVDPVGGDYIDLDRALELHYDGVAELQDHYFYDAAIIASPSHLHYAHAKQCIEAGMAVLVEKPLTVNLADAESLVKLAEEHNVLASMAQSYRYHPGIDLLRDTLQRYDPYDICPIGRPIHVTYYSGQHLSQWHPGKPLKDTTMAKEEEGGGVLLVSLSHLLDTIQFVFGRISELKGRVDKIGDLKIPVETSVDATMRAGDEWTGVSVNAHSDFLQHASQHYIQVVGTKGDLCLNLRDSKLSIHTGDRATETIYKFDGNSHYKDELKNFLSAVKYKKLVDSGDKGVFDCHEFWMHPPVPLESGATVVGLIEELKVAAS